MLALPSLAFLLSATLTFAAPLAEEISIATRAARPIYASNRSLAAAATSATPTPAPSTFTTVSRPPRVIYASSRASVESVQSVAVSGHPVVPVTTVVSWYNDPSKTLSYFAPSVTAPPYLQQRRAVKDPSICKDPARP